MTIQPDDKDWTWVLDRRCPECGLDVSDYAISHLAGGHPAQRARLAAGAGTR